MATHTESAVNDLQRTALENLWVYLREPSDMAEKGEPQIFVEGKGCQVTDALGNTYIDAMSGLWLKNVGLRAEGNRGRGLRADAEDYLYAAWAPPRSRR